MRPESRYEVNSLLEMMNENPTTRSVFMAIPMAMQPAKSFLWGIVKLLSAKYRKQGGPRVCEEAIGGKGPVIAAIPDRK